jgi:hypothetical protein
VPDPMSQPPGKGHDAWLTVVTLNTRGIPVIGSRLAARYQAIGEALDHSDADVVALQEVLTYWHLRLLARRMRSFGHVAYRPSAAGPAGGLVTFSRLPVSGCDYHGFPSKAPGLSWPARVQGWPKGVLVTQLPVPGVSVANARSSIIPTRLNRPGNRFAQSIKYALSNA